MIKKRQTRRRNKKSTDIFTSFCFDLECKKCQTGFFYRNPGNDSTISFDIKTVKEEKKIIFAQKNNFKLNLEELFKVENKSNERIIKRKGRKKWTEKHQKILKGCLLLFGEDLDKIHSLIPEFNKRFLKIKINHIFWRKYLLINDKTLKNHSVLKRVTKMEKVFDLESTKNDNEFLKSDFQEEAEKNIFQKSPLLNFSNHNEYRFPQEFSKQDFSSQKSDKFNHFIITPVRSQYQNIFDDSPFSKRNSKNKINLFGIKSTVDSLSNSKNISPYGHLSKRQLLTSVERENDFIKGEWIFNQNNN
jgi:hypothetical protein